MNVLEIRATVIWKEVFVQTLKEVFSVLVMKGSLETVLQATAQVSTISYLI